MKGDSIMEKIDVSNFNNLESKNFSYDDRFVEFTGRKMQLKNVFEEQINGQYFSKGKLFETDYFDSDKYNKIINLKFK